MRGSRLKALREEYGHTQESLAEMLGRDIKQVWRWETEKVSPSSDAVIQMAKIFGVTSDYLLGISDNPTSVDPTGLTEEEVGIVSYYRRLTHRDKFLIYELMNVMSDPDGLAQHLKRPHEK